jgi:hypothetical protein
LIGCPQIIFLIFVCSSHGTLVESPNLQKQQEQPQRKEYILARLLLLLPLQQQSHIEAEWNGRETYVSMAAVKMFKAISMKKKVQIREFPSFPFS